MHLPPSEAVQNSTVTDRFNAEAADWDSNPFVQEATSLAFEKLTPHIEAHIAARDSPVDVLEIGCGTGLLSTLVAPLVHEVVAVDTAPGMIEMLTAKTAQPDQPHNIIPICKLLEDPEDPALPAGTDGSGARRKFDLILSHLVLHHVPDVKALLTTMMGCLKPGGRVLLTDYQDAGPECMWFHPPSKLDGVERHGIPRDWMTELLTEVGFSQVNVRTGWVMVKNIAEWEAEARRDWYPFPFLICEGVRP
ncbi:class I SAM-dependent methyltransferase [Aspergillus candidus]|uniref:S-adenosyl-L-methionine-dependent methyltransferase n=1 Tax=Aspergillus candidus TaxID=41067 RepID=A0A2I2FI81_ASPCN|nr:S-adenosyl-L-methionine-dependent methyltransferase [Aspergillus candidus]PLB40336.1 S-adenosyl-L-methionine-dependent methyltransferase [Aspergillus candidus]